MKKLSTKGLSLLLLTTFLCQAVLAQFVFAENPAEAKFVVKSISVTSNLENEGAETFTIDSVKINKNVDAPSTVVVSTYKENKLCAVKMLPVPSGTGDVTVSGIELTQNGLVTDYSIKAYVWDNIQSMKPLAKPFVYGTREPAVLSSLSVNTGTFGSSITINGTGFSSVGDLNKVYFTENATGLRLEAGVVETTATTLKVISPVINSGFHKITVEIEGSVSNELDFNATTMKEPTGNETTKLLSVSSSLVSTTGSIVDMFNNSTLPDEQKSNLAQVLTDSTSSLSNATASFNGLSTDARYLINKILANGELPKELDNITNGSNGSVQSIMLQSTMYQSNSISDYTTTEILDQVEQLIQNVRSVRNTVRTINTSLKYTAAALAAAGAVSSIFGGSGSGLIALAAEINSFRTSVVVPVLEVLNSVYSVLACSMTSATAGSLEFTYNNDVMIDQYFGKMTGVPQVSAPPITTKSKLALLSTKIDDVSYYREEILNTLEIPYLKNSDEKMDRSQFDSLINKLSAYEQYNQQFNDYVFDQTGAVKSAADLRQNASQIKGILREYRKITNSVDSLATSKFWDIVSIENALQYGTYSGNPNINKNWLQLMKYTLEEAISSAEKLSSMLDDLISVFGSPSSIVDEADSTPQYDGFVDEGGVILAGQNYYLNGNMDFNVGINKSQAIDSMVDNIAVSTITNIVSSFVDMDIDLVNVPVRLTCTSSDTSIITTSWSDSTGLQIIPKKPGKATLTIYPDIQYIRSGKIKKGYLTIIKEFEVVSGDYTTQNYDANNQLGPRIDSVKDDSGISTAQGYLGENINIVGKGFSSLPSGFQNIYMTGVPSIGVDTLIPHFLQSYKQSEAKFKRENITLEIPDTLSGDMRVAVGLNQKGENVTAENRNNWVSNAINIDILRPIINFMPSNLIKGESYPVIGRGFSHTPKFNKFIFDNNEKTYSESSKAYFSIAEPSMDNPFENPITYENVNAENHSILHSLHNRLTFIVPNDAANSTQNSIKSLESDAMKTNSNGSVIKSFGTDIQVSNPDNIGMRPVIAYDTTTNKRLAMWVDMNANGGSVLVSSFVDVNGTMSNTAFVADNLGSIEAAPDKVALCAKNGKFYVAYVGKGTNNNDEIFLTVNSGTGWSMPKNISLSSQSSIKPAITADDFDHDGDIDILVMNIEDNGTSSNLQATILSYNDFSGYSAVFQNTVWQQSNTTPALYSENGKVAVAFNEYVGNASNIYVSKLNITGGNDTLSLDINPATKLSNNTSYKEAKNPSVVMVKSSVDNIERICAVWENTVSFMPETANYSTNGQREDIFMATVANGVKSEVTNLTNSALHSQGAVLSKGADETIALAFAEQGFTDVSENRTQGFDSKLYFTRSFDGGLNFQRPYMCMKDYGDNGIRLGYIGIVNQGNGDISLIWQTGNQIVMKTTTGLTTPPQTHYTNTKTPRADLLVYSENEISYNLTNASGQEARQVINKADLHNVARQLRGRLSISPSGRYIAMPSYWASVAEADGAFPIGLCSPHNSEIGYPQHIIWSDDENKIFASFIEFGIQEFTLSGIMNSNHTIGKTFGYNNPKLSRFIYFKEWNDESSNYHKDYYLATNYGAESVLLTSYPNEVLAMSPDGNAVLYVDKYEGNKFSGLCVQVIGSGAVQITDKEVNFAEFSSDGSKIAYVAQNDNAKNAIFVLDMATNTTIELYEIQSSDVLALRFTPDGSSITLMTFKETVLINTSTKAVTPTNGFVTDFAFIGQKNANIIVSNGISVLKPSGTGKTAVTLSKQPTANVTVNITCPGGLVASKTALTFTPENYNTPQEFNISCTSEISAGAYAIELTSQSSDYVYDGVKINTVVAVLQGDTFTTGGGFIQGGYDANVAYPILHNWSRQSIYKATSETDVLWQTTNNNGNGKILADGNGNTIIHGQDLTYDMVAYNKAGAKLWQANGYAPIIFDSKVYYTYSGIKYRDITTGAVTDVTLVDANNTGKTYYPETIFFVDSNKNIYTTAITYEQGISYHYIMKIAPSGSFKVVRVTEQRVMDDCALPVVTSSGKILVHSDKYHDMYVNIYNAETLVQEGMVWDYDDVLNISVVDQNQPNHSIFFVTTKDDTANTVTVKAMRTFDKSALWNRTFNGNTKVNANPAVTENGAMYLPIGNIIYAVDVNNGNILWQYDCGKYIGGAPIIDAEGAIYFTAGTDLVALNKNGTLLSSNSYATSGIFTSNVVIASSGQIIFGGGADSNSTKLPIFSVGKQETTPKSASVYIEQNAVTVDEDDGDVYLKVVDDTQGTKGGFTADIMLVPDTATMYNDYTLDWTHSNNQIVFAEGESVKYIKINISQNDEVASSRKFKVKLSAITGNKQINSDLTEVTIKDVSLPYDERFKVGFERTEFALKEGNQLTLTVNRGANQKVQYPAAPVKIYVGNESSYSFYANAMEGTDYTILPKTVDGRIILQFAEGEISKNIVVTAVDNQASNDIRKLDLRINVNSAIQQDLYSGPPQNPPLYPKQTKVYIVEPNFTVPTPVVKVVSENEIKVSNIMYWGKFEVYNPQGEKVYGDNGMQNSLDAEYSVWDLPTGNGYKIKSYFGDVYVETDFNIVS